MAEKVLVNLVCKGTGRRKQGLISADFGLEGGKVWSPGAQLTVPQNWFDSIPESTEYEAYKASLLVAPTHCSSCGGTGREVSGDIFADYQQDLEQEGEIVTQDLQQILKNPQLAAQAQAREEARRTKSPEVTCTLCKGTGKPQLIT